MARTSARIRGIAGRHESVAVARVLLLTALLALTLLASATHAKAENVPAALLYPYAAVAAESADLSSPAIHDGTAGKPCQTHGQATVQCSSTVCCSGGGCQAPMELAASTELFLPRDGKHALPLTEAAKPGSPSPDMFRPPIS
jgi:hypothetical protein